MFLSLSVTSQFLVLGFVGFSFFKWKTKKSNTPERIFTEALFCLVQSEKEKAVQLLKKVVDLDTNNIEAYLLLGKTIREDYPEQAIKIHKSLTIRPGLSKSVVLEIHKALSEDYRAINRLNYAKRECENILKIDRRNKWAIGMMLEIAKEENDWYQAEKWNRLLIKIIGKNHFPDLGKINFYSGKEKMDSEDISGAKSEFNKAIKLSPELSEPYYYLGKIYEREGNKNDALSYFKEYVLLNPNPENYVYKEIENLLYELNQYSQVENIYISILEKYPENEQVLIRLINYKIEIGNSKDAISYLDKYLINTLTVKLLRLKLSLGTQINQAQRSELDRLVMESIEKK